MVIVGRRAYPFGESPIMVIYQDQPPINHRLILCFSLYMAYYFHLFSNAAPTQAWIHFVVPPPLPPKKTTFNYQCCLQKVHPKYIDSTAVHVDIEPIADFTDSSWLVEQPSTSRSGRPEKSPPKKWRLRTKR